MASTCQALAQRYARETSRPIPDASASTQNRSDWLLTSQWGCIPPGGTVANFHSDSEWCKEHNSPAAPAPPASTAVTRPPTFNYLKEDGFLHWVNQRGLQCVNRIVGNFYGFDPATGNAKVPSVSVSQPPSQCAGACFQVTSTSDMCFECINQVLLATPSLCPELNPNSPDDESLIRDAVNCHECIGTQATFVPAPGQTLDTPNVSPNVEVMVNTMFQCITGSVNPPLSTASIATIALACVFFATAIIMIIVFYTVIEPRIKRREAIRHVELEAGVAID